MAPPLSPFNLMSWVEENQDKFPKPVGNKVIWPDSEFIAFVNGGNARNDFHINPGDEIFFQVKGDARVDLMIDGKRVINPVREGDVLLVPAWVPHAPRRPAGTWAFIFERPRSSDELDGFAWYCEGCDNKLHEVRLHVSDIETQLAGIMQAFNEDVERRTCDRCGGVLPVPTEFVMEHHDDVLAGLGLELPKLRPPAGHYVPYTQTHGSLLFLSGQGADAWKGRVGADLTLAEAQQAARDCMLNLLAQANEALGTLDRVERVAKIAGFVACTEDFTDTPEVLNGASDLLAQVFPGRGEHARSAVGVQALPRGFAVEIEAVFEVRGEA